MRTFLLSFFTLFCSLSLSAQMASVNGRIGDAENNPVSFATVMLMNTADSSLAKAGYSGEDGSFSVGPVGSGNYFIKVTYLGMKPWTSTAFTLSNQEYELGLVQMEAKDAQMKEVVIQTERPVVTVKPDMTVFNVEGTVNAVGENAFNLLRKAPGVMIDNNDNVMLLGKSGVRIYIDGKPSPLTSADLANLLKGMQSDQIESFEIITNPSSKFDAEGNAGIINIRMKRDKNMGANATLNLDYSYWLNHRLNGGLTANYRGKKVSLFGNYSAGAGATENFMDFLRIQNGLQFDQNTNILRTYVNHNFRTGADFYLSKKHTAGVLVSGFLSSGSNDSYARTDISNAGTDSLTSILESNTENDFVRNNLNANLNYRYDNQKGYTLSFDADYGVFNIHTDSWQPNQYLDPVSEMVVLDRSFTSYAPTDIDILTFKADHEMPLFKGKLGAGAKAAFVNTNNVFDFYNVIAGAEVLDTLRTNQFEYEENVNAAYVNFNRQIKKWGFQAGLRAEQTNSLGVLTALVETENERVERHYINLFPSGGITYAMNKMNTFRLTYSRRIDRPKYQDLNPFQWKIDELSYMAGNPFLQPQFTHNIEIGHTYKYTLNSTVSYAYTTDFFTNLTDTVEGTRTFMTQRNLSTRKVITASVSYPWSPFKWWSTFTNASVFNVTNEADFGENKDINLSVTSFNVFHQSTFSLPKDFGIQLSGFYNSPGIWGANFRNRKFWGVEAGVTKKVFEGRGLFKVGISDIFFTMQWRGIQEFGALYMDASGGWESRQLKASYTHSFGNSNVKARKRTTGMDDENKRAGESGGGPGR